MLQYHDVLGACVSKDSPQTIYPRLCLPISWYTSLYAKSFSFLAIFVRLIDEITAIYQLLMSKNKTKIFVNKKNLLYRILISSRATISVNIFS